MKQLISESKLQHEEHRIRFPLHITTEITSWKLTEPMLCTVNTFTFVNVLWRILKVQYIYWEENTDSTQHLSCKRLMLRAFWNGLVTDPGKNKVQAKASTYWTANGGFKNVSQGFRTCLFQTQHRIFKYMVIQMTAKYYIAKKNISLFPHSRWY